MLVVRLISADYMIRNQLDILWYFPTNYTIIEREEYCIIHINFTVNFQVLNWKREMLHVH